MATLVLHLSACSSLTRDDSAATITPVLQNKTLNISKSLTIPLETIAAGAAIYFVIALLAQNWKIQEVQLAPDKFQIALQKKQFSVGGDGEAIQVFRRRAQQITRMRGYASYLILEYTEGIESKTLGAQRVSYRVIQINKTQAPQSNG